jgi:hypothetical protein
MDPFAWFGDLRIAAVGEVLDGASSRPCSSTSALRRPIN